MDKDKKKVEAKENTRVVTHNNFIKGCGMEKASLKATKLLYIAIAQCRKNDGEFYEYSITVPEFAALMDVEPSNVYPMADAMTTELVQAYLRAADPNDTSKHPPFKKWPLFAECEYTGKEIVFQLNKKMTDFLLNLRGDFSKPLLDDFLHMNSVYSIRIWHLLQKYMKSQKPVMLIEGQEPEYYISLDELREVTGTKNKMKQISEFKRYVLDKALREIEACAGTKLVYRNKKSGKSIVGFIFRVVPLVTVPKEIAAQVDQKFEEKEQEEMEGQITMDRFFSIRNE